MLKESCTHMTVRIVAIRNSINKTKHNDLYNTSSTVVK